MIEQQRSWVCPKCGSSLLFKSAVSGATCGDPYCDNCGYREGGEVLYALPISEPLPPPKKLFVIWKGKGPTPAEAIAVRQLSPSLAERPVSVLVAELAGSDRLPLGSHDDFEIDQLVQRARALGLRIVVE
jgi:hypothetical protein